MPKRDLQDGWSLLTDLARELSWILRIGLFGGLGLGLGVGIYLAGQISWEEARRGFIRLLILFVLGMGGLGAFLGLVLGVIVELIVGAFRRSEKPKPRKRPRP
ncbi:MAG: hypothetical protein U0840_30990 [Gemmataceae bacterium]